MIITENIKTVKTYDMKGNQNGYLTELEKDGNKTKVYLSAAFPGCKKGFHVHLVREANYRCIRGKVKVVLITENGKEEFLLDAVNGPQKLHIPTHIPTMIVNEWDEEGWVLNFPEPYYDPELKGEQLDLNEEEAWIWVKLNALKNT